MKNIQIDPFHILIAIMTKIADEISWIYFRFLKISIKVLLLNAYSLGWWEDYYWHIRIITNVHLVLESEDRSNDNLEKLLDVD